MSSDHVSASKQTFHIWSQPRLFMLLVIYNVSGLVCCVPIETRVVTL